MRRHGCVVQDARKSGVAKLGRIGGAIRTPSIGLVESKPPKRYVDAMERHEAISRLKSHEADLKQLGVLRLYMFGSTARNDAQEASDVDLFFDYEKGKLGVFELMDVKDYTSNILDRDADITTRDSLHTSLRAHIEETAVRIF